jgi:hypothetical protein
LAKGEIHELLLPDDDAEAIIIVCGIVHMNWEEVRDAEELTIPLLLDLASLVDK